MSLFSLSYPVHSFQMPDSDASFLFCHSHVLPLFCEVDSCPFPALLLSVGMLFSVQSLVITLERLFHNDNTLSQCFHLLTVLSRFPFDVFEVICNVLKFHHHHCVGCCSLLCIFLCVLFLISLFGTDSEKNCKRNRYSGE